MAKGKILFVMQLPPPYHGASIQNHHLLHNKYIREKYNIDIINLKFAQQLSDVGVFEITKLGKSFFILLSIIIKCLFNKYKLVLFTFSVDGFALIRDIFFSFFIKLLNKKVVYHLHSRGYQDNKNGILQWLLKISFENVFVIQHSALLYPEISKFVPTNKAFFVPNGIPVEINDSELENIVESRKKPRRGPLKLLFLSNIAISKGFITLLQAVKLLIQDDLSGFRVIFAGDWRSEKDRVLFEQTVSELGIQDYVIYVGFKRGKAKKQLLMDTDILVFPTVKESFGIVNVEAMQYALPVISTIEGSIPEVIKDQVMGFLIPKNDASELAGKIKVLLKDRNLRIRMGMGGRAEFLRCYTLEIFDQRIAKVLNSIMTSCE